MLAKLTAAYALPTVALFSAFGWLAYDIARRDLDAELGKRLASLAEGAAGQIRGRYLIEMDVAEEGPTPRAQQKCVRTLENLVERTGAARVYVFRPDGSSLCDTAPGIPIGHRYHELDLDRHELERVLGEKRATSSVLFKGSDGRFYKAGYAPVHATETDETVVAALRVEAPADYFQSLRVLRARLVTYGALLGAVVVAVSIVVATRLTRPLRRLSAAAARIGRGDLGVPVDTRGTDEIGVLARTLEEMRQALRARDERLQMMLAGIAHEVRNPLGGIELFAGILREELPRDDERQAHVARIEKELGHLGAVVSDFLEYARRPKPDLRPVELARFLGEVRDLVVPDADKNGVTVELERVDDGLEALADEAQLRRAILNLVRNAVQATPRGGRVGISAADEGDRVRIRVSDTGRGIDPSESAKIFQPFFTTKEKGTGLGLAFAREIARDHGGDVTVESEPGQGATFTIDLRST